MHIQIVISGLILYGMHLLVLEALQDGIVEDMIVMVQLH